MVSKEHDFLHYLKTGDMELTADLGIPTMNGIKFKKLTEPDMVGFNYATVSKLPDGRQKKDNIVHFFLADYVFERLWNNPERYVPILSQYKAIVSPDFSQYTNMPRVMQMWNHYRKMWLSQYYQARGIKVIPAPCWSDEASFEYCFEGMPKKSLLCISTAGCVSNKKVFKAFMKGYEKTLEVLEPSQLIIYGIAPPEVRELFPDLVQVDTDQKRRIKAYEERCRGC